MQEQHEWKRYDDDNHVFVNQRLMNYGVVRDTAKFSRTGKAMWIFIPLIITGIIITLSYSLTQSFIIGIVMIFPCLAIDQWLWRKFVFEENRRKDLLSANGIQAEFTASYFNNTLGADTDGLIMYQQSDYGYTSAYLVTFNYGSLAETETNVDKEMVDGVKKPFLKQLSEHSLRFKHWNVRIKSGLSKGTMNLIKQNRSLPKNSTLRIISSMQNEACACLEQNNSAEYKDYYLILCDAMSDIDNFRDVVQASIDSTLSNSELITEPHICDIEEINEFGKNSLGIKSFNINALNRNIGRVNLSKFFIIDGFVDSNGIIHNPSELSYFPTQKEEVNNAFNHEKLLSDYHKAQNKERQMTKQKELVQNSKKHHNFVKVLAQNQRMLKQQQKEKMLLDKQMEDKKKAENQQKMMKNRTKNFNELLKQARENKK